MSNRYKTYISYVIQKGEYHKHESSIVDFATPKFNFYFDNESQQVVKWAEEKQNELSVEEKLIIVNFFHVADIK
jgi:hypothetical protein